MNVLRRDERGVSVGYAAVLMLFVMVFSALTVTTLQYLAAARQATTAADLAALAGAGAATAGSDPCRAAAENAAVNRARVDGCEVRGSAVSVTVSVAVASAPRALPARVWAHAVAGPA